VWDDPITRTGTHRRFFTRERRLITRLPVTTAVVDIGIPLAPHDAASLGEVALSDAIAHFFAETFMSVSRIARWAVAIVLLTGAHSVGAQATTTSLGNYILCRTTVGASACFQLGLTTAARLNGSGVRDGTTGVVSVRSLQGTTVVGPAGQTVAASNAITVLSLIEFVTPGCLPGLACGLGDYFGGVPFGTTVAAAGIASANGTVGGTPTNWSGSASMDGSAGISVLAFSVPGTSNGVNATWLGLGGCTAGTGSSLQYANLLATTAVRTCDEQGLTGMLNLTFSTNAIFDPTFFWGANVRFFSETTPGSGNLQSFYCGVGGNRRGEAFSGGIGGTCGSFAMASSDLQVVPEPATVGMLGAGLVGLLVVARRRRTV